MPVQLMTPLYKTQPASFGRGPLSPSLHCSHSEKQTNPMLHNRSVATEKSAPDFGALGEHPDKPLLGTPFTTSHEGYVELQKSASRLKPRVSFSPPVADAITPAFWYSPTRFSKKFVLPCKEINSIQSKGLLTLKILVCPSDVNKRSATNPMYVVIKPLFMPMRSQGNASQMKRRSVSTAPLTMLCTISSGRRFCSSL